MNEEENKVEVTDAEEAKVEETVAEEVTEEVAEEAKAEAEPEEAPAEELVVETGAEKKALEVNDILAKVKKNILWIAVAVVALLLICLISSCAANSGSAFTLIKEENTYFQTDSETLINMDGEEITVDEGISGVSYSADQSLTVVKDKEATLFVVAGKELVEVDVEIENFVISNYGDTIAYIKDTEEGVGTLYLYNVSKKAAEKIADEVYAGDIVLSADGKSVAYITDCEVEEGWFSYTVTGSVYVSKNGKEGKEVSGDAVPLAVSNGGKYVFYVKDGEKLYMNEEKLSSDFVSRVYFNEDCTEIIFNEDDDTRYFTAKMKEPVKVKKGIFSGIYAPENMVETATLTSDSEYAVEIFGVETFNEAIWCIDYSEAYYVFNKGEETEKLSSDLSKYQMSVDGKSILYQDGGELILVKNIKKSREGESVARGLYSVSSFVASEDLEDIYYYDTDEDELCYLKKGEGVRIADDAENFVYSDKYGAVYFIEDDELFYGTKNAKSVKDVCGEEVSTVYIANGEVYFVFAEDGVYSIRKMKSKAKYETVFELDMEDIWDFNFGDIF